MSTKSAAGILFGWPGRGIDDRLPGAIYLLVYLFWAECGAFGDHDAAKGEGINLSFCEYTAVATWEE